MNTQSKILLTVVAGAAIGLLIAPLAVMADDVPGALSVESQGQNRCEKLFEDAQILISRCSFAPGAVRVCYSHPYISYVLSGGKALLLDERGTRQIEVPTGSYLELPPPVPRFEMINTGDTTLQFLNIEKKYQAEPSQNQTMCPNRTR